MAVVNIKNKYVRRSLLLLVIPVYIIIYPIRGLYLGIIEGYNDYITSFRNSW